MNLPGNASDIRFSFSGVSGTTDSFSGMSFVVETGNWWSNHLNAQDFFDAFVAGADAIRNKLADISGEEAYRTAPVNVTFTGTTSADIDFEEEE